MDKPTALFVVAAALILGVALAAHAAYSIPEDQIDSRQIYFGSATSFEKPAEVSFESVVRATPEFREIRTHNIERGTGKYWIRMTRASERASVRIRSYYRESNFDLLTERGYLKSVDSEIPVEDITDKVVESLEDS